MQFRTWLENRITRDEARSIVLDALGAGNLRDDQKQQVLGSTIGEQPSLLHNLRKYSELAPYIEDILSFVRMRPQASLIDLITYIEKSDQQETTIRNIQNQDVSGLQIGKYGSSYVYSFMSGGNLYEVTFEPHETSGQIKWLGEIWSVSLKGPEGYAVTGMGNFAQVYGHMLQAIKRFILGAKPIGLMFHGENPKMNLVYDTFYRKFLQQQFIRIAKELYLRRDIVNQLSDDDLEYITDEYGGSAEDFDFELKVLRKAGRLKRKREMGGI